MPEGHTIHRLAKDHTALFVGRELHSTSPQGRFSLGAKTVDGRVLERIEAYGKHLVYWFEGFVGVHVHLGLYGRFTVRDAGAPLPGPNVRWRVGTDHVIADLAGAARCELTSPERVRVLYAQLGPDPLRRDGRAETFVAAALRCRLPIGAALLDQRLLAGVGNVFRAEALFVLGIHPDRLAASLDETQLNELWVTVRAMLREGVRSNQIKTVPARERDRREPPGRGKDRFVYHRTGLPCRRCGTPIIEWQLAARRIFACPTCQPPS